MPRAIWSGTISFGLVSIPVKLYNAVSRKSVHFNQIDTRTNSRIKQKRVSEADGTEVPSEALAKGYQLGSGEYVIITEEDLAALDPEVSRSVEIEEFIDLADIDPVFYDSAYLVAPDKATVKPYALLQQAMEASGKVGIARFVMRTKQYLAAIRPVDGKLMLSTMVYADELNDPAEIPELAVVEDVQLSERELGMARQLIESLAAEFEPERFQDTYREQVLELIERKASGATELVEPSVEPVAGKVVDLMAALEASVSAAKEARGRHPTSTKPGVVKVPSETGADDASTEDEDEDGTGPSANGGSTRGRSAAATTAKAPARKRAAKTAAKKQTAKKTGTRKTA